MSLIALISIPMEAMPLTADSLPAPGSVDPDFHFLHTESLGLFRGIRSYDLSGISRAFSRAFESVFAGGGPAEHIAVQVGEGYFCIIECSQNKSDSGRDVTSRLSCA